MDTCELCGKHEDERNTQQQMGYTICLGCDGLYSDEELQDKIDSENNYSNPRPIHWDDYYSHLDIPKHWINSSYPNDELPSFICNEFQIWINSPSLKERKENYAHLGQSEEFKDWIFVVTFEKNYGVEVNDLLYTKNFQELLDFVGGDNNE
jgi:hypothetical protein